MGGTNQGFRPFYFLRPDSNCDARGPDYGTLGPAELNRWTGMWSELIRRPDVQNKAHRIVLGQDGYCQGILGTGKLRLSLRDSRTRRWVAVVGQWRSGLTAERKLT